MASSRPSWTTSLDLVSIYSFKRSWGCSLVAEYVTNSNRLLGSIPASQTSNGKQNHQNHIEKYRVVNAFCVIAGFLFLSTISTIV